MRRNARVGQLSKGMVTQLHLALVMAIDARLLVLDEPTLGLDILFRKQFYDTLLNDYFDERRTIIVTTHQVEELEHILTDLMFIDRGRIVLDCSIESVRAALLRADGRAGASRRGALAAADPGATAVRPLDPVVRRRPARAPGHPRRGAQPGHRRPLRRRHRRPRPERRDARQSSRTSPHEPRSFPRHTVRRSPGPRPARCGRSCGRCAASSGSTARSSSRR